MKLRVPLYGAIGKVVWVDDEATKGAIAGTNLYLSDGKTLVTDAMLTSGISATSSTSDLGTTDDLAEGQYHFYFTNIRAQDAVGVIVADSANVSLSYVSGASLTADLIDLADSGTGAALVKITRDSKGRIAGTSAATTDDLAEGANLYYTDLRAAAAAPVQSVNGATGTVVLTAADVGAATTAQGAKADSAVQSVVAGTNVTVDDTDPQNPVINVASGAGSGDVVGPASSVDSDVALFDGTTGKLLKDGGSFGSLVLAAVLTGLSTATSAVIAATDTVLGALGKLQAQITDNLLPSDFISGAQLVWVSATAVTVKTGAFGVESTGKVLRLSSDIAKTGLSLSASTLYYMYGYDNSGTPDIEFSTTAPATPYRGTARSKTGVTSRRFLGAVLTDSSGNIISFSHAWQQGRMDYRTAVGNAPFQVLGNGRATAATNISMAAVTPVGATHAVVFLFNAASTAQTVLIAASDGASVGAGDYEGFVAAGAQLSGALRMDGNRAISYAYQATPSGASGFTVRVGGYLFGR